MKRVLILILFINASSFAIAQTELIDRVARQAIEIDSLKKVVIGEQENNKQLRAINRNLKDTVIDLKSDLKKLGDFKAAKDQIENLINRKTDTISLLKQMNLRKDSQMLRQSDSLKLLVGLEYKKGKSESITTIINSYKYKTFDELVKSSTFLSVDRDLMILENQTIDKQTLNDLKLYFLVRGLLDSKFDPFRIKTAQEQLSQIKQESVSLNNLKQYINDYQIISNGLKETLGNICELDKTEIVSGYPIEIQKKKLDKILGEIASYMFSYDFNFSNYPFLSDILFQIMKRKQANADSDISDLLKKL